MGERLSDDDLRSFYDRHYRSIVGAVALVSGSRAAAEDCVHEALARAWERTEAPDRVDRWVVTVALNLARNRWRREVPEGPAPSRPVSVIGVATGVRADGGQRVSVQLDGPVPDEPVTFVEDITDPRSPGVGYTTQGPSGLHVCGDRHWFPGEIGSVDVLLPAEWLVPGSPDADMRLTTTDVPGAPGKVVACGPTRGYVQYSIWGATSDDPADVQVIVEPDGEGSVVIVDIAVSE